MTPEEKVQYLKATAQKQLEMQRRKKQREDEEREKKKKYEELKRKKAEERRKYLEAQAAKEPKPIKKIVTKPVGKTLGTASKKSKKPT